MGRIRSKPPFPPLDLASRVGSLEGTDDPWGLYEWVGRDMCQRVTAALPEGYSLEGRRVLDFGCGAGRTLRHFIETARGAEFWGCDIDADSIEWLQENLSPAVRAFHNGELPPLDQPDETFDVVYCVSVFTHLTRSWSAWLVEMHRVLKPGGLLIVTYMGEGESERVAGEPWDEEAVGMLVLNPGQSWDLGGPMVLHSPWWIREHWGRLFDVLSLTPHEANGGEPAGHGIVTLRKRDIRLTPAELERPSDDERELTALAHNVDRLMGELEILRPTLDGTGAALAAERDRARALETELARCQPRRSLLGLAAHGMRTFRDRVRRAGRGRGRR